MDLPPVLSALAAKVSVAGPDGLREIAVERLYKGFYETALAPNDLIAEVIVPPQKGRRAAFLKCTTRSADDWPALGIAVSLDADGPVIRDASIFISAATQKVTRLTETQRALTGVTINDAALLKAGDAAAAEAALVGDARGSVAYKRHLLRVCIGRAIRMALADGGSE